MSKQGRRTRDSGIRAHEIAFAAREEKGERRSGGFPPPPHRTKPRSYIEMQSFHFMRLQGLQGCAQEVGRLSLPAACWLCSNYTELTNLETY